MNMKLILGRKIKMSQIYNEQGQAVPVTVIKVGNGIVSQVKTVEKDGYSAVQMAFNENKKNVSKALSEQVKEMQKPKTKEFKAEEAENFAVGQKYGIDSFVEGEVVDISGISKGRGFTGVVKRYNFKGAPKTHGHKHDLRAPGSIGATDAARVFPGMRMAGRTGGSNVTVKNLTIAKVDLEGNLLMIKGAVPGPRFGLVSITSKNGEMKEIVENKEEDANDTGKDASEDKPNKKDAENKAEEKNESNDTKEKSKAEEPKN